MEKKKTTAVIKPIPGKNGGARPGAGRKKGGTNGLTIESLLATVQAKANGKPYEALLVEDFLLSRTNGDGNLTQKYHHLILSKVAPSLAKIETSEGEDTVQNKAAAFAEALATLAGISKAK